MGEKINQILKPFMEDLYSPDFTKETNSKTAIKKSEEAYKRVQPIMPYFSYILTKALVKNGYDVKPEIYIPNLRFKVDYLGGKVDKKRGFFQGPFMKVYDNQYEKPTVNSHKNVADAPIRQYMFKVLNEAAHWITRYHTGIPIGQHRKFEELFDVTAWLTLVDHGYLDQAKELKETSGYISHMELNPEKVVKKSRHVSYII